MKNLFEHYLAWLWNSFQSGGEKRKDQNVLRLGRIVRDGQVTSEWFIIPERHLESHVFILGVTGSGKTKLVEYIVSQAVAERWGLISIIQHPDLLPFILGTVAEEERESGHDLSGRCPIINFADRSWATGLNLLDAAGDHELFVLAAEVAEMIRVRFDLDAIGVRILELLRNVVYVLASCGYTLVEFRLFLNNAAFRATLLKSISNTEVKAYFTEHYDRLSVAEQGMYAAALLNKISELAADPLIAQVIGQQQSAVSITDALDKSLWLAFNADKAVLREQGTTLSALFFVRLKNAIFARRSKRLSLVICDEVQNLLVHDAGLDLALSESRKMHAGIVTANQTLEQLTTATRAALLGCGTQIFFRLAAPDADKVAGYLGGGKHLAERLKHLPQRHVIIARGDQRFEEVVVPTVVEPTIDTTEFYQRCMQRWAKPRQAVAEEIRSRHEQFSTSKKALEDWE